MTTREGTGGFNNWGNLRDHAIDLYGETPHPATEQEIIDAYQLHPDAVEKAVTSVANDVKNGTVRSGWGALRYRAGQISTPIANPTRNDSLEREKRIMRAEQWIRNAGLHYDDEGELLLTLFDGGLLSAYAQIELEGAPGEGWQLSEPRGDLALVDRMTRLYHELRPLGIRTHEDAEKRAAKWREERAAREAALEQAHTELQAQITARQTVPAEPAPPHDPDADLPL